MIDPTTLTPATLAGMIDHTFLKPDGDAAPIEKLCAEARKYGFVMVAINPAEVERCTVLLAGSRVRVGAAIGFPLGQNTTDVKLFEIGDAIARGAGEIDMVINQRELRMGNLGLVRREIEGMVALCRPKKVISKVILECCNLTDQEKVAACLIAREAGCDFVKTSTGLASGGATVADIRLMRETVGPDMGVKASGGVRTLQATVAMIRAGATRIGTSSGVGIVEELIHGGAARLGACLEEPGGVEGKGQY